MRTDSVKARMLLLAAALLGIGTSPLAAQDPAREAARVEEEVRRSQARIERETARVERVTAQARAQTERELARAEREVERAREAAERAGVSVLTGDHVVEAGEVVEGDMVVVGGDLRVEGEILGNAVVTGGDLLMEEGGKVLGDAVVTGGELIDHGGRILGEMRTLSGMPHAVQVAPAAPRAPRRPAEARFGSSWFREIGEGIAGVFSTLAFGLVLAGMGAGLVFYGLPYLRTVSETVRNNTGRSAAVGLAASFLVIPAFILLIVALAISIIGIPLLLVAVPLYPLLVVAAFGFGLLAVAHGIGEYTSEQRGGFEFRHRNAYAYVFFGIALLLAPILAGHMIGMVGFLDWVAMLLQVAGGMVLWVAATVGMGAVILSRAGTRRDFASRDPDPDPLLDQDPLFDSEPVVK